MDSHPTPYARILAGIREQLTGDPERDLPFLNEQAERYREEPWARPFLRELGRIFYDLMPAEQRAEAARVLDAEMERMQALQQQAWEHLEQGRLDQAQNLLDELRQAVQGLGESDLDAAFVDYSDPLEAEFHRLTDPKAKTFRPSPLSHRPLLILQARIHLLRDEPEQALRFPARPSHAGGFSASPPVAPGGPPRSGSWNRPPGSPADPASVSCSEGPGLGLADSGWCLAELAGARQLWWPCVQPIIAGIHLPWLN